MLAREAKQELSLKAKFLNYSPQPMISVYPRVFSYSYPKLSTHTQGRNGGVGKGGTITRAPNHYGDAESLRGRWMTAEGVEKAQNCHKYFLQYSAFASERS